jgi:hypothetical protein
MIDEWRIGKDLEGPIVAFADRSEGKLYSGDDTVWRRVRRTPP